MSTPSPSPILSLPSNVLGRISLHFVRASVSGWDETTDSAAYYYKWIIIGHICRQWRNAVLRTPELWQDIVVHRSRPDCVKAMVKRSGELPLSVRYARNHDAAGEGECKCWCGDDEEHAVNMEGPLALNTPALLYTQVHRLRDLTLDLRGDSHIKVNTFCQIVQATGATDAPYLEKVKVMLFGKMDEGDVQRLRDLAVLSDRATTLPRLRTLNATCCPLEVVRVFWRTTLTALTLNDIHGTATVDELLDVLAGLHNLEMLVVKSVLGGAHEPNPEAEQIRTLIRSKRIVSLPRLVSIVLTDTCTDGSASALLLHHLDIPTSANILFCGQDYGLTGFNGILQALEHKARDQLNHFGGGHQRCMGFETLGISYDHSAKTLCICLYSPHSARGQILIMAICGTTSPNEYISAFCTSRFPLQCIHSCQAIHPLMDEQTWFRVISKMQNVIYLLIEGEYSAYYFLRAMETVLEGGHERHVNCRCLYFTAYNLKTLELNRINWCAHKGKKRKAVISVRRDPAARTFQGEPFPTWFDANVADDDRLPFAEYLVRVLEARTNFIVKNKGQENMPYAQLPELRIKSPANLEPRHRDLLSMSWAIGRVSHDD